MNMSDKYIALANLSICYKWNSIKSHKNNKSKPSALIWINELMHQ